jgi:hypothetical protein
VVRYRRHSERGAHPCDGRGRRCYALGPSPRWLRQQLYTRPGGLNRELTADARGGTVIDTVPPSTGGRAVSPTGPFGLADDAGVAAPLGEVRVYHGERVRDPHGRGHPDQPPPRPRPRLLRAEARRGQDPQRGTTVPETPGQRCRLRPAASRRPPGCDRLPPREPGRATGERLHRQRGRLTPQDAGSSAKPLPDRATHPTTSPSIRSGTQRETPPNHLTQKASIWAGGGDRCAAGYPARRDRYGPAVKAGRVLAVAASRRAVCSAAWCSRQDRTADAPARPGKGRR